MSLLRDFVKHVIDEGFSADRAAIDITRMAMNIVSRSIDDPTIIPNTFNTVYGLGHSSRPSSAIAVNLIIKLIDNRRFSVTGAASKSIRNDYRLTINIGLPHDWVAEGTLSKRLSKLNPLVRSVVRHEIQHIEDFLKGIDKTQDPINPINSISQDGQRVGPVKSLRHYVDYLSQPSEIRAHVIGMVAQARVSKQPIENVMVDSLVKYIAPEKKLDIDRLKRDYKQAISIADGETDEPDVVDMINNKQISLRKMHKNSTESLIQQLLGIMDAWVDEFEKRFGVGKLDRKMTIMKTDVALRRALESRR